MERKSERSFDRMGAIEAEMRLYLACDAMHRGDLGKGKRGMERQSGFIKCRRADLEAR